MIAALWVAALICAVPSALRELRAWRRYLAEKQDRQHRMSAAMHRFEEADSDDERRAALRDAKWIVDEPWE